MRRLPRNAQGVNILCFSLHFWCSLSAAVRQVLGIINKPGCFAQYITLPIVNLHAVPAGLSDAEAAFCEPLAAACRILEQGLLKTQQGSTQQVAVVGECYGCGVMLQCT